MNSEKLIKFKTLALATGEIYENGTIEEASLEIECLPASIVLVRVGKQNILVNMDYLLSLELETVTAIS